MPLGAIGSGTLHDRRDSHVVALDRRGGGSPLGVLNIERLRPGLQFLKPLERRIEQLVVLAEEPPPEFDVLEAVLVDANGALDGDELVGRPGVAANELVIDDVDPIVRFAFRNGIGGIAGPRGEAVTAGEDSDGERRKQPASEHSWTRLRRAG